MSLLGVGIETMGIVMAMGEVLDLTHFFLNQSAPYIRSAVRSAVLAIALKGRIVAL